MRSPARFLALVPLLIAGCARPQISRIGVASPDLEQDYVPPPPEPPKLPVVDRDIVSKARLPISGFDLDRHTELEERALFDRLSAYDVVCVGENHDDPHHHFAELALLDELERRARYAGRRQALGLEMFQAQFQPELDAWTHGSLSESELLDRTEYAERWGFPSAYYVPLLELGRERSLKILALNARTELTHAVAKNGIARLSREEARELPELDLDDREHRASFDRRMAGHPHGHGAPDDLYAAQVLWDEKMATEAAHYLSSALASRLLIVAGEAHCARAGIPQRIERRIAVKVASVLASVGIPEGAEGYQFALVMSPEKEP